MLRKLTISASLIVSLAGGSCVGPQGDFADIYTPVCFAPHVAAYVVAEDRQAAEGIALNNAQLPEEPCL